LTADRERIRQLVDQALLVLPSSYDGLVGRSRAWRSLADLEIPFGDLSLARCWLARDEELLRALRADALLRISLQRRGVVELGAGEFEMAIKYFSSSAEIAERLKAPNGALGSWVGIGVGEAFLGRRQEAVAAFSQATTMVTTDTESAGVERCTATLGRIADAQSVGAVGPAAASDPRSLQRQLAAAVAAFH
jgi:hypothetical protein